MPDIIFFFFSPVNFWRGDKEAAFIKIAAVAIIFYALIFQELIHARMQFNLFLPIHSDVLQVWTGICKPYFLIIILEKENVTNFYLGMKWRHTDLPNFVHEVESNEM